MEARRDTDARMADQTATHALHERPNPDGLVWETTFAEADANPAWSWRHLDLVNPSARHDVETDVHWSPMVRRVVAGTDETPRVVVDDEVLAGVLPSFARTGDYDEFTVTHWHFAASRTRLLTTRRHPARSLAATHHASTTARPPPTCPMSVIMLAITDFSRAARLRTGALDDELDAVETALLSYRDRGVTTTLARRIGHVRREAVDVRRALAPVARMMTDGVDEWPEWAVVDEHDSTVAAVMGVLDDIAALSERARSLQDELTSRLTDETNRRLYIVSVVTTLMMPATFVTGFFGMNTGGFVWGEAVANGTLYAGLTCLLAVLAMLGLLKWTRLL